MHLVEFVGIKKRIRGRDVLSNVSFNLNDGEVFGLVGTSGSGKTTLLKILIGMLHADKGTISFEGRNALKKVNYLRKNTGFATQDNMLFEEMTIKENAFYFGKLYGIKHSQIVEKFNELLRLMRLEGFESTLVKNLSGGMNKRANLLVSLINSPKLLILDEPTVGLDPILRKSLWKYIKEINKRGTTILVTSHLLDELEENCNRIAILKRGKIVALASIEDYRAAYGNTNFNDIFQEIIKNEDI
jgi:ABC-2 type transport system ATP-binding protein